MTFAANSIDPAVPIKVVPQKRTRQFRKDLWVTVAYICLIEFHFDLARGRSTYEHTYTFYLPLSR